MKCVVKNKLDDIVFPIIIRNIKDGAIVLCNDFRQGTIISPGETCYKIGDYLDMLTFKSVADFKNWELFNGTVELSN